MKFSIVTNAYNQGQFLQRCMNSVLSQSFEGLEYIVVNPGSTDDTEQILAEYEARGDPRLRILREKDDGPADGLNKAFAQAKGEWFGYINADDFLLEGALDRAAAAIQRFPECDCIFADGYITDVAGQVLRRVISTNFDAERFVWGRSIVLQQSTFWKADSFRKVDGFNSSNNTSWDAELLVDMSLHGMKLRHVRGYWAAFVLHPDSITGSQRLATFSRENHERMFEKVTGHKKGRNYKNIKRAYQILDLLFSPKILIYKISDRIKIGRPKKPLA